MTQVCSISSSTASAKSSCENKRLPKGIHIIGADSKSAPRMGGMSFSVESNHKQEHPVAEDNALPWGYIYISHMSAGVFEERMRKRSQEGEFCPRCFIHRTVRYKQKPSGKGVLREKVPSISGLVFLQGTTRQLRQYLIHHFPQYYLVNNCSTGLPASIPDRVMEPFMSVMKDNPERVTFLRDPFTKFASEHVRLRVLTGVFKGQEGYVVRVDRDRRLVMDLGGYAVAIRGVHQEDFEIVE